MNALDRIRRHVATAARWLAYAAMTVIGLMMLTITYDVVVRYVLTAPTDWAFPLNAAGVLVATSLTVPHLYAGGAHIAMDLVHRALPAGGRRVADLVTGAATAFLGLVLAVTAYRSMRVALDAGLTGSGTFGIPLWIPDAALLLTGLLLTLVAVLFPPGGSGGESVAEPPAEDAVPGDRADSDLPEGTPNR